MNNIKKYSTFNEDFRRGNYYRIILNEIHIYIDEFIKTFKDKYKLDCWFLYNNKDGVSLEYFQSSDDSAENITNVKKFMFEKAPYFRDVIIHRDDHRIILKFFDPGEPIKFKFFH